ncbi:MAG TPA: hypothetical protein VME17_10900 [Bryobacteraceae bacterium]|nr:hypothetical protein [Bryobacteraceae bacterium]
MKEVFTKSFWQGVKKTFDQALEDPPPAEDGPGASSTSATPPPSATPSSSTPSSATASPTESPDN